MALSEKQLQRIEGILDHLDDFLDKRFAQARRINPSAGRAEIDMRIQPLLGFVPERFERVELTFRGGWLDSKFLDFQNSALQHIHSLLEDDVRRDSGVAQSVDRPGCTRT